MKYTVSNTINKPLDHVTAKFFDPQNALEWMPGLKKIVPVSGKPGEVGTKTDFHSEWKGKEMVIQETILERKGDSQIKFQYESKMGFNEVEMIFEKIDDNSVKQINNSLFHLKGGMKIMGFLFKGMFKKQSMVYLNGFKEFAEK